VPSDRHPQNFFILLLIFIIVSAVFLPALQNGFTNWDDDKYVTDNLAVRRLSPANLLRIFSHNYVGSYVPLTIVSFALDYRFFKYHPLPYHAANVLLHVLNCLLVFWIIRRISGKSWAAFVAALFFGVHPLRVESVAWITERKDVLYSFFFLSGLLSYGYYRIRSDRRFLAAAFFLFVASVLSKPVAVVFPLALLLIDYLDRRPSWRTALIEKIPFFAASLATAGMAIIAQRSARTLRPGKLLEIFPNLLNALRNLWFYVAKTAVPANLSAFYPVPAAAGMNPGRTTALVLPIIALIVCALYLLHRIDRRIVFGILFFLIGLLPVLQLIPSGQPLADRYPYLASAGLSCLLALGLSGRHKTWNRILSVILLIICVFFATLTWRRCPVWHDSLTLWNDVLVKYPNVSVAYNNRGRVFQDRNDRVSALADFDRAIIADPGYALAYYNRGVTRFSLHQYDLALADLEQAAALDPGYYKTFNNRGLIYYLKGETDRALNDFERALSINPEYAGAYNNRGLIRQDIGQHEKAIADFDRALAIDPSYAGAYNNRGLSRMALGRPDLAVADYSRALAIDDRYVDAYVNRAHAYLKLDRYDEAREDALKLRALGFIEDPELNGLLDR
jgi:tetratricopeptide (TPR) repeat protein